MALDPLKVRDAPSEQTYQLFEEAGTDLGQERPHERQRERER